MDVKIERGNNHAELAKSLHRSFRKIWAKSRLDMFAVFLSYVHVIDLLQVIWWPFPHVFTSANFHFSSKPVHNNLTPSSPSIITISYCILAYHFR